MLLSIINQYPDLNATGCRLRELLSEFASLSGAQFRCLVAFASLRGLKQIEEQVLLFLQQGGLLHIIVGVDLQGTSREAVECLLAWKRSFPKRVDARVFTTADNLTIFHPKVYWFDAAERRTVVVGSANATAGGLIANFEVSVELQLEHEVDSDAFEKFDLLWMTYSSPLPPLTEKNLLEIDRMLVARLQSGRVPTDGDPKQQHPLASGDFARTYSKPKPRRRKTREGGARIELIMDILEETRRTQVQLPVNALQPFFEAQPERKQSMELIQVVRGDVVKQDVRPFIHLANNTHRLEVDAIRGLPRPQIIRFWRGSEDAKSISYEIILRGTRRYKEFDSLLTSKGTQTRSGARRWLIREVDSQQPAAMSGVTSRR
jgi:HKD family nuclease